MGSNLGNREQHLGRAIELLQNSEEIRALSSIYETEPWGFKEQPLFLNQCIHLTTDKNPIELLELINTIELEIGRTPTEQWKERVIDIDVLFYNNIFLETDEIKIPHPHLENRRFVLEPLIEIAPDIKHPMLNKTVQEMLVTCTDTSEVNIITPSYA